MSRDDATDWIPAALLGHAVSFVSKSTFDANCAENPDREHARQMHALASVRDAGTAGVAGVCPLCDAPRRFVSPDSDADMPNLREGLVCTGCRTNARIRAGLAMLQTLCADRTTPVYITEQVSSAYLWLRTRYPASIGSEFARDGWHRILLTAKLCWRGAIERVRSEDVTRLSLATASQRAVASFDVLEHVPDYRAALREFARVTAPDGWLILTAPFSGSECSIERARMLADGRVEHLHPAEYHGDPLGGRALCFHHFGWNLLDELRAAGYRHAAVMLPWWPEAGLFDGLTTIVAQR